MKNFILIAYDITNTKRRNKVAKTLVGFGKRVQYSVFECFLTNSDLALLKKRLEKFIDLEVDSIRFYKLDIQSYKNIEVFGSGVVSKDEQLILI